MRRAHDEHQYHASRLRYTACTQSDAGSRRITKARPPCCVIGRVDGSRWIDFVLQRTALSPQHIITGINSAIAVVVGGNLWREAADSNIVDIERPSERRITKFTVFVQIDFEILRLKAQSDPRIVAFDLTGIDVQSATRS